jgi:hypothetical protein
MGAICEAVDLVTGDPPSAPFSLDLAAAEIVALLFPPARPRARVLVATSDQPLSDALSMQPQ